MTGVASLLVSASSLRVIIMGASDLQNMALEDFSVKMLMYLNIGVSRIACYWLCVPGPYITSDCISNMYLSPLCLLCSAQWTLVIMSVTPDAGPV